MARSTLLFLLLSIFFAAAISTPTTTRRGGATNFIKSSCSATTYPDLCVQSLSVYANTIQQNPHQLAQTALIISLSNAQNTQSFVSKLRRFKGIKPREYGAIKDCLEEISDTVDRLSKSVEELKLAGGKGKKKDYLWRISNVETWVSAALTDENTCVDGFAGKALNGRIKSSIKGRFDNVAKFTSNALALVNKLGSGN